MIYIITVYDSLNYGSYFQAYALKKYLSKYGNVCFLDVNHQNPFLQTFLYCGKHFLKFKISDSLLHIKKYWKFKAAKKKFLIKKLDKIIINDEDVFVFGSDEIWNIDRAKIRQTKEFFGYNINSSNKISYAVSVNTATKELFDKYFYTKSLLNDFKKISVRDQSSKKVIDSVVGCDCSLVIDPTLLVDCAIFEQIQIPSKCNDYILLYTYGRMLKGDVINQIKKYAKDNNKKIISVGNWFDFCDYNISASPEEFLGYVKNADYVFTDTFHGIMFSLIFQKQFVAFDCGNTKVKDVLCMFELYERYKEINDSIESIVSTAIDYSKINELITNFRRDSMLFIDNYLSKK